MTETTTPKVAPATRKPIVEPPKTLSQSIQHELLVFVRLVNEKMAGRGEHAGRAFVKEQLHTVDARLKELGIGKPEFGYKYDWGTTKGMSGLTPCWGKTQRAYLVQAMYDSLSAEGPKKSLREFAYRNRITVPTDKIDEDVAA